MQTSKASMPPLNTTCSKSGTHQSQHYCLLASAFLCLVVSLLVAGCGSLVTTTQRNNDLTETSDFTLRSVLTAPSGFHLAMAPAFFGFYGYFGVLTAWEEEVDENLFQPHRNAIKSVVGASAGAMAAVSLAAGVSPRQAADFCSKNISLSMFADFPGLLAAFQGKKFQRAMYSLVRSYRPNQSLLLQDAILPVAVSGFDIQSLQGKILSRGSMARAARASATFPLLFQPVGWKRDEKNEDYLLIDGGIADRNGWRGLGQFVTNNTRIVHILKGTPLLAAPGPDEFVALMAQDGNVLENIEVISVVLTNLPLVGPWALEKGPIAVEAARQAMIEALDRPLRQGDSKGHYLIEIDGSRL